MKYTDVAIVILSCDKFKVTWKPCIDHLFNAWPNCPYSVYLLNNYISCNDKRVIELSVREDLNWSDSLKKGLLKITSERVFFIYDDSFISYLNILEIEEIFNIAIFNDLDSVTLRKNPFDNGKRYDERLYLLNPITKYRNALFLNIIKRRVLLSILKSGENAWQFEKDGNERSKNINFYSVYKTNLAKYHHGIVKGKWLPKTKKYLITNGYDLNDNPLEQHSYLKAFLINFYKFLFFSINKFIHFSKRITEPILLVNFVI